MLTVRPCEGKDNRAVSPGRHSNLRILAGNESGSCRRPCRRNAARVEVGVLGKNVLTPAKPAACRRLTAAVSVGAPTASGIFTPPLALIAPAAVRPPASVMLPDASTCGMAAKALAASVAELAALVADVAASEAAVDAVAADWPAVRAAASAIADD